MDDETTKAIEMLKAEVFALRAMLISHIIATNRSDPGVARAAIEIANAQIDPAVARGQGREAVKLGTLIRAVTRHTGPGADND